jgi:hypothetical protein
MRSSFQSSIYPPIAHPRMLPIPYLQRTNRTAAMAMLCFDPYSGCLALCAFARLVSWTGSLTPKRNKTNRSTSTLTDTTTTIVTHASVPQAPASSRIFPSHLIKHKRNDFLTPNPITSLTLSRPPVPPITNSTKRKQATLLVCIQTLQSQLTGRGSSKRAVPIVSSRRIVWPSPVQPCVFLS